MASTFNLLTAGGARFNKQRFGGDIDLFSKKPSKPTRKGKERATALSSTSGALPSSLDFFHDHPHTSRAAPLAIDSDDESEEEDDDDDEEDEEVAPPKQKITLTGAEPLPKSLHANLPALTTHPNHPLPSSSGEPLLKALRGANITGLWGVQCAVAGCLLDGKDVMCVAPTGSGKTLSYLLPTLVQLRRPARDLHAAQGESDDSDDDESGSKDQGKGIRSLVLVPTHDLAIQIAGVCKAITQGRKWRVLVLSKATERAVCESAPGKRFGKEAKATKPTKNGAKEGEEGESDESVESDESEDDEMEGDDESTGSTNEFGDAEQGEEEEDEEEQAQGGLGVDILIATPERLHHLLDNKLVHLKDTRHVILDESDRLLSDDFRPQILPILSAASNPAVQKCFLSATMPAGSEEIAKKWLRDGGVRVVVGLKDAAVSTVSQSLLYTASEPGKLLAIRNLVSSGQLPYPSLVFVQSVARAEDLTKTLILDGLRVDSVHGNRTPAQREAAVRGFREGSVWILVVTEVLARGMDFRGVKVVVNYDFPQTVQSYIHRIGRTGRAGRPGTAITFFSDEDAPYLRTIANVLRASGCAVPEYMLEMKKPSKNLKRFRAKVPVKRKEVGGGGRDVARERGRKKREMVEASKKRKVRQSKGEKGSKAGEV